MKAPIAVALDAPDLDTITKWSRAAAPSVDTLKVGLETYLRDGGAAINAVRATDCRLFLDLKLHDIPNTVAGACRSVAKFSPEFLTVHASGGAAMIRAAAESLPDTRIVAVTILTSMSEADLEADCRPLRHQCRESNDADGEGNHRRVKRVLTEAAVQMLGDDDGKQGAGDHQPPRGEWREGQGNQPGGDDG